MYCCAHKTATLTPIQHTVSSPPLGPITLRVDGKYIQSTFDPWLSEKQRFSQEVHKFRRLNV